MRKLQYILMALAALLIAVPAFAATGDASSINMVPLGAGLGMGIAAGLCGIGQGKTAASAAEAMARNPGARSGIMLFFVLGLAFIESLSLFTLVIVFAVVKQ